MSRKRFKPPLCAHCGQPSELVDGRIVYPHRPDLSDAAYWRCVPCRAHVGCHSGTIRSYGTPANHTLRSMRRKLHSRFDPLWQSGGMERTKAYELLAAALEIPFVECHIGMFDNTLCNKAMHFLAMREHAS